MMGNLQLAYLGDMYSRRGGKPDILRVLTYHRIGNPADTPHLEPRQISATTADFEQQMAYLSSNYRVMSIAEVLAHRQSGERLPERAVLITFDDACVDVKSNALPVLQRYNLPATVFVPTAYPGHPERAFWWDRLYRALTRTARQTYPDSPIGVIALDTPGNRLAALKKIQNHIKDFAHEKMLVTVAKVTADLGVTDTPVKTVLDWDELRELAEAGLLSFGAHTRTHPILTNVSPAQASDEISGSFSDLRREIPRAQPVFAYPNGNHSPEIIEMLAAAGCQMAFTTSDGFNNMKTANPFALRRVNITRRTSLKIFKLRLQRWFSYLDVYRHG